jgi:hypothetical protein
MDVLKKASTFDFPFSSEWIKALQFVIWLLKVSANSSGGDEVLK